MLKCLTAYGYGRNYVIVSGLQETNVPNPNITWETAKTWNIGLDATLWNGLLGIEFDYFKTRRSDILTKRSATIPTYTGLLLPDENIGIVDNKGFELVPTHANSINDFRYSLSRNVSFARNKVVFADEQPAVEPARYSCRFHSFIFINEACYNLSSG
ncbi:MAG: TonB-dependent receptor [Tannerella sp.]|nr:TonB-dependent receptor [Tannerella sp.]